MRCLSAAVAFVAATVGAACGLCRSTDEVQVPSPDRRHVARAYLYDCGATTGHTTRVDLDVDGDWSGWQSVYTADQAYDLTLRWANERELLIECNGCPPRHPGAPPVSGISVRVGGSATAGNNEAAPSLTVPDTLVLTVIQVERVTERRVFRGLGAHSEDEVEIERPGEGRVFPRVTVAVRWLAQKPLPCNDDGAPPLIEGSQYALVDSTGLRLSGLDVSYEGLFEPCTTFTVLFPPSRADVTFDKFLFAGREANVRQAPGASPQSKPARP